MFAFNANISATMIDIAKLVETAPKKDLDFIFYRPTDGPSSEFL